MSKENSADVLVIAASNGENLKLAQRFVDQAQAQGSSADLLDLTTLKLPCSPRARRTKACRTACSPYSNN